MMKKGHASKKTSMRTIPIIFPRHVLHIRELKWNHVARTVNVRTTTNGWSTYTYMDELITEPIACDSQQATALYASLQKVPCVIRWIGKAKREYTRKKKIYMSKDSWKINSIHLHI